MPDWNHSAPLCASDSYARAMIPLRVEGDDPTNPALDTFQQVAVASLIAEAVNDSVTAGVGLSVFTSITGWHSPAALTQFTTAGYSTPGIGAGTYVADALATSAMAAAHPLFCKADAVGRYFRLLPGKAMAISQGGALGGMNNDQPAGQAAIDYAKAIGCRVLLWDFDIVSLWCPTRTSAAAQLSTDAWAQDGQSLWITAPIKFQGLGTQTRIKMLGHTGGSLETDWQNVSGNVWRGSGINLIGGSAGSPNANGLTAFAMEDIWLDGGCAYTGVRTAVTPSSPDGPDLTNKGIRLQDTQCDKIVLNNCIISGFKGEAYYAAGTTQTDQWLTKTRIFGSNQSAFNPSTGFVRADNCEFGGSWAAAEILGGIGGRLVNCKFYGSAQFSATGGPANGDLYNFGYPTRDLTNAPPWLDFIDCTIENCGQMLVGNYVRMSGWVSDCSFYLVAGTAYEGGFGSMTSCYIDVTATADGASQTPLFILRGPPNLTTLIPGASGTNYILPISDVHIRVRIHRSQNAIAQGRSIYAFQWDGEIDQNSCSFEIEEGDGLSGISSPYSGGALSMPLITCDGGTISMLVGAERPWSESPIPISGPGAFSATVSSPRHSLSNSGAAGTVAVTMAAPFTAPRGYAPGQPCRIYYDEYSTAGTIYTFAKNGTGLRLNANRGLYEPGDWIDLEFNVSTGLWHEVDYQAHMARLTASKTWSPGTLANGASVSTTLTVTGAVLGDAVDVITMATDLLGCTLISYVSAPDTITAVLSNATGASKTVASATLRGEVTK